MISLQLDGFRKVRGITTIEECCRSPATCKSPETPGRRRRSGGGRSCGCGQGWRPGGTRLAMTYQYQVRDPLGNVYNGSIEAASPTTPRNNCARRLQIIDSTVRRRRRGAVRPDQQERDHLRHLPVGDHGHYRNHALRRAGRHPRQEQNPTLRRVLDEIKTAVEEGDDYSTAWPGTPSSSTARTSPWSRPARPRVRSDRCWNASPTRCAGIGEPQQVRSAMTYPGVMMAVAIGVTIFLLITFFPSSCRCSNPAAASSPSPPSSLMTVSDVAALLVSVAGLRS